MLVIIANHLPDAVRGVLKVWCLEPKPHVFVTDINQRSEEKIVRFLQPYFKDKTGLVIIASDKTTLQGFTITQMASPERKSIRLSGLQFIEEKAALPIGSKMIYNRM
jgi:CRISPR-associated endoribonuclease Cas2, subtype I-E/ECOLI